MHMQRHVQSSRSVLSIFSLLCFSDTRVERKGYAIYIGAGYRGVCQDVIYMRTGKIRRRTAPHLETKIYERVSVVFLSTLKFNFFLCMSAYLQRSSL